jgi:WD40 repeat protein
MNWRCSLDVVLWRKMWTFAQALAILVVLGGLLSILGGCAELTSTPEPLSSTTDLVAQVIASPLPTDTPSPTNTSRPTATPTVTPRPPTATFTPSPTPTPTPALSEISLGVPGGDCYGVQAMVTDPDSGILYVLCEHTDQESGHTLIAVDGTRGERLDSVFLGSRTNASGLPELSLDPQARRLYLTNTDLKALVVFDADTLQEVGRLPGVLRAVPAPGADRLYAVTEEGLVAYRAGDLTEQAVLPVLDAPSAGAAYLNPAYNSANDRLYIENEYDTLFSEDGWGIVVLNGEDLSIEATLPVTDVRFMAADAQANRVYALASGGRIVGIDGESQEVTEQMIDLTYNSVRFDELFVHGATNRVHIVGSGDYSVNFWLVLDGESLQTVNHVEGLPKWGVVSLDPKGHLLAVREYWQTDEVVVSYDPDTGQSADRLVLGRRLLDAGVDPDSSQVYVLDSAGGLTVLDASDLQVVEAYPNLLGDDHPGLWDHEAALDVDRRHRRLFVADELGGETLALDLDTLEPAGTLDVAGPMAVDVEGGRLFIADEHIYVYDTTTLEPVGDEPALRLEGSPDGMYSAPDPEDIVFDGGRLFIRLNAGGVKSSWAIVGYTEFDPDNLESLGFMRVEVGTVGHSPVVVPGDGRVWLSYEGHFRHGLGAYAEDHVNLGFLKGLSGQLLADAEYLYLLRDHSLLVLDPERGYPLGVLPLSGETWGAVLDDVGDRFYLWGQNRAASIRKADLLDGVSRPQPGLVPEDAMDMVVRSPSFEEDGTLFAVIPDTLEPRSEDGSESWRPFTGIYRSKDGGETWQLTTWGIQNYNVEDLAFDQAYGANQALHVVANALFRSDDDGQTWQPDSLPDLAFVSDRTGDKEIYTMHYGDVFLPFGTEPQRLTDDPAQDDHPDWSADGGRLVFQSDRSGNQDLWIVNYDGTGLVQLTSDLADDLLPAWSPDGQLIAFTSARDGSPAGYVIDAPETGGAGDESSVRRLIDLPSMDWRPRWSGDAWRVVFVPMQADDNRMLVVDRDGANPHQVSSDTDDTISIRSSGYFAIYADSEPTGNFDLYHEYDTGPAIRRLTTDPSDETDPAKLSLGLLPPKLHTLLPASPASIPIPSSEISATVITAENAGLVVKQGCRTEDGAAIAVFSPDGRLLAVAGDESFHLYDAATLEPVFFGEMGAEIESLAFYPGGRLLAVAAGPTVDLWNVGDCPKAGESCASHLLALDAESEGGGATSLAFSPDGKLLAADSRRFRVLLWRVGSCTDGTEDCGSLWYTFPSSSFWAFSPDGQMLALGSGAIKPLYRVGDCEVQSDACLARVGLLHGAIPLVDQVAWSSDGETLAVMGGSKVWFFDMGGCTSGQGTCGAWQRTVEQPSPEIAEAFGPDGTVAASGGYGGRVYLWALDDGRLLHTLENAHDTVEGLAFSPAHAALASVGQDDNVCVWHLLPEPRNPDPENLLYEDDFSDPGSGWLVLTKDDYEIGYQKGAYRLALDRDKTVIWGQPEPALSLGDFAVEVDAHLVAGPLDSDLGLLIRYDLDDSTFYFFQINGEGEYKVLLRAEGKWIRLVQGTAADAANTGHDADNRLRVVCDGERFSFYVNDVHVTDVVDDTLGSGGIGLAVGTYDEPGIEVHFDNLRVYALEE